MISAAAQAGFGAPAAPPAAYTPRHAPINFAAYPNTREGILSAVLFTGVTARSPTTAALALGSRT